VDGEQGNASPAYNPTRRRILLVGVGFETVLWAAVVAALAVEDLVAWALAVLALGAIWNFLLWRHVLRP
jgi:hypothetical protein